VRAVLGWVGTPQRMLRSDSCLLCVIAVQNAFRSAPHTLPLKSCARCRLEQLGDKPRLLSLLVVCHVMATKLNNFPYALLLCSKPVTDLSTPAVISRYSSVAAPSGLPPRLMTNVSVLRVPSALLQVTVSPLCSLLQTSLSGMSIFSAKTVKDC